MRQLILALPLIAGACAIQPAVQAVNGANAAAARLHRDIGQHLAGHWHEVAGFYDAAQSGCSMGISQITPQGQDLRISLAECAGLGRRRVTAIPTSGPGRYYVRGAGRLDGPWWVLMVDTGYRIMVVVSPHGRFGAIFGRTARPPAGLYLAARHALAQAGFDMARLRPVMR